VSLQRSLSQDDGIAASEPMSRTPVTPASPVSLESTGLSPSLVVDLLLKHLLRAGDQSVYDLGTRTALPVPLIEPLLGFMRTERLVEVPRRGSFDADVAYVLTDAGRARAGDAMDRNQYVGPAPVSLDEYLGQVERQQLQGQRVPESALREALAPLVVNDQLVLQLGAAMNSWRPLFLYGPSGSGKTCLAEHLVRVARGNVWIPHAITVDGEIIQVYDPAVHQRVEGDSGPARSLDRARGSDARWMLCRRPVVQLGGELTLSMMDLELDPVTRYYRAPAQLKANNGMLIFDDLGRQRSSAHAILNRWIVPLDRKVDYLALHTGTKCQVPFDVAVIFSSNLTPSSLADPAFVRRLGYKIRLAPMSEAEYLRVFRLACARAGLDSDAAIERFLIEDLHKATATPLLPAYPADLVQKLVDLAIYEGTAAELTPENLRWSWQLYFAADQEIRASETGGAASPRRRPGLRKPAPAQSDSQQGNDR